MCYDISANLRRQLKAAMRVNDENLIAEINAEIDKLETPQYHHVSGFAHPKLLIYTNEQPVRPIFAQWGLIPHWSKSETDAKKFWNNTLNARSETIFEKPSFRESAKSKRCLIYIDGFFEHHHLGGKKYPFFVRKHNGEMMCLGGLWSQWLNKETDQVHNTFSILTTKGNEALSIIHNNPKLKEPRMPVVLHEESQDEFLQLNSDDRLERERLFELMTSYPSDDFEYYPVNQLRGKEGTGNSEIATKRFEGNSELWKTIQDLSVLT